MSLLVLGATGFLGHTVCKLLDAMNTTYDKSSLSLGVDLRDADQTNNLFAEANPDQIINCAAYVGGIQFGYEHPAELFTNNMRMSINIFEACNSFGVKRLVNPISNCTYPAQATYFKEDEFWDGPLHESVLVYGMARKMQIIGSWAYNKQFQQDSINLIMSNMYGPGDHTDPVRAHALGAMMTRMLEAKRLSAPEFDIWGTGKPVREWLYVEDGAQALINALNIDAYDEPINVGVGEGLSIAELASILKNEIGYEGELVYDTTKQDGAAFKTVDGSRGGELMGWRPETVLREGIQRTLSWIKENEVAV